MTDAALSPTQSLQDEATRVLGDWPTRDAAPVLLSIADGAHPYRVRALRGYLRIVRQFDFSDAKRVEMVGKALPLADRDPERLLALAILEKHPSKSSLKLAQQQLDISLLGDKASPFVVAIAEQVVDEHPSAAAAAAQAVLQAGGEESIRARRGDLQARPGQGHRGSPAWRRHGASQGQRFHTAQDTSEGFCDQPSLNASRAYFLWQELILAIR